jgi:hypothetical protein
MAAVLPRNLVKRFDQAIAVNNVILERGNDSVPGTSARTDRN